MYALARKKKRKNEEGAPEYMVTYADIVTLLLTFFILLLSTAKIEGKEIKLILANFPGLGNLLGGNSFIKEGVLPHAGYVYESLPSDVQAHALNRLQDRALVVFKQQINNNEVQVKSEERGVVISIAADYFFDRYSADVNLSENSETLRNLALLMREFTANEKDAPYRIEGHTDETNIPAGLPFKDDWDLSAARSIALLRVLEQFMVSTDNAQVVGLGNTRPYAKTQNESPFNRRVDIVILNQGNL